MEQHQDRVAPQLKIRPQLLMAGDSAVKGKWLKGYADLAVGFETSLDMTNLWPYVLIVEMKRCPNGYRGVKQLAAYMVLVWHAMQERKASLEHLWGCACDGFVYIFCQLSMDSGSLVFKRFRALETDSSVDLKRIYSTWRHIFHEIYSKMPYTAEDVA